MNSSTGEITDGATRGVAQCPHCRKQFQVNAAMAGRTARCKACGETFTVALAGTASGAGAAPECPTPQPARSRGGKVAALIAAAVLAVAGVLAVGGWWLHRTRQQQIAAVPDDPSLPGVTIDADLSGAPDADSALTALNQSLKTNLKSQSVGFRAGQPVRVAVKLFRSSGTSMNVTAANGQQLGSASIDDVTGELRVLVNGAEVWRRRIHQFPPTAVQDMSPAQLNAEQWRQAAEALGQQQLPPNIAALASGAASTVAAPIPKSKPPDSGNDPAALRPDPAHERVLTERDIAVQAISSDPRAGGWDMVLNRRLFELAATRMGDVNVRQPHTPIEIRAEVRSAGTVVVPIALADDEKTTTPWQVVEVSVAIHAAGKETWKKSRRIEPPSALPDANSETRDAYMQQYGSGVEAAIDDVFPPALADGVR